MNARLVKIVKVLGVSILALFALLSCSLFWMDRSEEACWNHEAVEAFQKYGSLKTRAEVLRVAGLKSDPKTNPVEILEKDPNGCSFGSNGQTVLRFTFNDRNELTAIQAFRNYIASNYQMTLIAERTY